MTDLPAGMHSLDATLRQAGVTHSAAEGISDQIGEIYVMVTWDCNLRCRMCPFWGEHGICTEDAAVAETLTSEKILEVLADTEPYRPRTLTISGGEPLLSQECMPLTHGIVARGHRVMLTTNATLLHTVAPDDLSAFHQINISLDGPPLVLERLRRGGNDTLEKGLAGLRKVRSLPDRKRPSLQLLTVITDEGAAHLLELIELFEREGVSFDRLLFQHQMFLSQASAGRQHASLERLLGPGVPIWNGMVSTAGRMDVDRLLSELTAIRQRYPNAIVSPDLTPDETRRYYTDASWLPSRYAATCASPWLDVGLAPNGDVWLCPGFSIGNVFEQSFADIWNGPRARRLRQTIASEGAFEGCRACFYLYNYRLPTPDNKP